MTHEEQEKLEVDARSPVKPREPHYGPEALELGARLGETEGRALEHLHNILTARGREWCELRIAEALADQSDAARLRKNGKPRTVGGRFFKLAQLAGKAERRARKAAQKRAASEAATVSAP